MEDRSPHLAARGGRRASPAIVWIDGEAFAGRLRGAMLASRWSYRETARRARKFLPNGATISDASVWSYAKGRTLPRRMAHVKALARVLGFSIRGILEPVGPAVAPGSDERAAAQESAEERDPDAAPGAPMGVESLHVVDAGDGRAIITIRQRLPWQLAIEILDLVKGVQPEEP